jgi:hypothetical protein
LWFFFFFSFFFFFFFFFLFPQISHDIIFIADTCGLRAVDPMRLRAREFDQK